MLPEINVSNDGTTLTLTAISEYRCAPTHPHLVLS